MPLWPKRNPRTDMDEYGRTELWRHCGRAPDIEAVKHCLAAGADPDQSDDAGFSPLHIASLNGNVQIVSLLLSAGANPNATDKQGNSPLWTAILSAPNPLKVELIEQFLNAGADPHHQNKAGKSPYSMAMNIAHGLELPFQNYHPPSA